MKTEHNITCVTLEGKPVRFLVTAETGPNHFEECGVCKSAFAELNRQIKNLNGARFLMKSDREFAGNGNFILVNARINDYVHFFAKMIKNSMSHLIDLSGVNLIRVSDSITEVEERV